MKKEVLLFTATLVFVTYTINCKAQSVNTSLSNLTSPTSVNQSLLVDKDNTHNIGSPTKAWKNIYIDSALYIANQRFISPGSRLSNANTAIGFNTLKSDNLNNFYHTTAVGNGALSTNIADDNTSVGWAALANNTTGYNNTAIGSFSLTDNNTGTDNVVVGYYSLTNNIAGSENVAIGSEALLDGSTIDGESDPVGDVAIGYRALSNDGNQNSTAVGAEAGINCVGANNSFFGYHAGNTVFNGASNTIIGYGADVSDGSYSNATALGNYAVANASNHIKIGNSSVTKIGGQVSWSTYSDARIKNNIQQNVPGLQFINLLKPVTYHYDVHKQDNISGKKVEDWIGKYDIEKTQFTGFLAQDVEAAAKKINYDFSGVDTSLKQ